MAQFRAKARAVDLLGKGQIADLPTAISELWKNGYDAYGDNLEVFLYLSGYQGYQEPVFVLSDDGIGMSRQDILDKWFVLGTDSKSRRETDIQGEETLNKPPRIKMGEKGIGRLAVAYLGPQMLMLTKKINHPLEAVFFDWRILENYNLFLDDINIPIKTIDSTFEFQLIFEELKDEFLQNFPKLKNKEIIEEDKENPWKDQKILRKTIIEDCQKLTLPDYISDDFVENLLESPTKTHSTIFVIFQPDEQITELEDFTKKNEVAEKREDVSGRHTINSLIGLFNPFREEIPRPQTAFWIYRKDTGRFNIFDFETFFLPDDFDKSDHLIEGTFDEYGKFDGTVRIYKKEIKHTFQPITKLKNKKTGYGSFDIKLGYVPGLKSESLLNDEIYSYFEDKLEKFGGLYIYRDNFRVLPYGREDNDFLEFEERRSRNAGNNFFAKKRMFGYLDITKTGNPKLTDKSSREGFITNLSSRDFKSDLISFFKDLAKKYFATNAEEPYKKQQQAELKKLADAERQEKERERKEKQEFNNKLKLLPNELKDLEAEYDGLVEKLEVKSNQSQIVYAEVKSLLSQVEQCKIKLSEIQLNQPARFKLNDSQKKKFHKYSDDYHDLKTHFEDNSVLDSVREKLEIQELFQEFQNQNKLYQNKLSNQFLEYEDRLEEIFEKLKSQFDDEKVIFIEDFLEKYKSIIPSDTNSQEISASMKLLENIFKDSQERVSERVTPFFDHLEKMSFEVNEDNLVGYYKIQFEEMKEELSQTHELAQLGIAVEIIDHQFNALYSQLAESIRSLKSYLLPSKNATNRYHNLDVAFEHLRDNYSLLQPLYRTVGRVRKEINGAELKEYVEEFFKNTLEDNEIKLTISKKAEEWSVFSYESIFKAVTINIVNNAIYWLQPVEKREIKIDVIDDNLLIMNSGEPIADYQLEEIFRMFYSNRPKGRGIGLYLAKINLKGIGYEIKATNDPKYSQLNGACFSIYKKES
jgi:hypothetical protein